MGFVFEELNEEDRGYLKNFDIENPFTFRFPARLNSWGNR